MRGFADDGQCKLLGLSLRISHGLQSQGWTELFCMNSPLPGLCSGMELRHLRHFVAVAETGSISRAAQKVFLTQPALSRQIKALEEDIGQILLERQAHSVRLTPAGEVLVGEARELLRRADEVLERVRAAGQGVRLRVGYAPSLADGLLSAAVEQFSQRHRHARIELFDLSTQEMLSGLEAETLEVAITVAPEREVRGLQWTPLLRLDWRLAVSQRHPLAKAASIRPEELSREPLLIFCQRDYPEYWVAISDWMRAQRLHLPLAGEYDGVHSLLAAVASGLGVALVAKRADRFIPEGVRLLELAEGPREICIAAGCRRDRLEEEACAVFLEELRMAACAFA